MEVAAARVPDAVAPPPGHPRFPLVDALRAVALLCIFTLHVSAAAGLLRDTTPPWYTQVFARLDLGLTLFFLISGFLMYRPFVAARLEARRAPSVRDYARARALRILPAYWFALTLLAIYPGLPQMGSDHAWAFYALLGEYVPEWTKGGITQSWSLSVEIAFYAVLPLLALIPVRLARGGDRHAKLRGELLLLIGLVALSLVFRALLVKSGYGPTVDGFRSSPREAVYTLLPGTLYSTLPAMFDWFALGMALAVASVALHGKEGANRLTRLVAERPSIPWVAAAALFVAMLAIAPGFPERFTSAEWFAAHAAYGVIALLLLAPAVIGHERGGLPRRVMRLRPLAWLGLVSYGFYLFHVAVLGKIAAEGWFDLAGFPRALELFLAGSAITTACAAASYYALERPLLRHKYRRRREADGTGLEGAAPVSGGRSQGG